MKTLDELKSKLIDRIVVSNNEQLLKAIETILNSTQSDDKLQFSSYQIEMLMMSERDIEHGNLISETDLEKADREWMN